MYHRVLLVASAEGFIIKGLETKLKGIGLESSVSPYRSKEIEEKIKNTDMVIMYTDDGIMVAKDALGYIKDYCSANGEPIIVIGTKEEYEIIKSHIPENIIYRLYERPLDMEQLIEDMQKYSEEESQPSRIRNILIVDDDVAYMSMIMDWLKDKYRVFLANSGMKAITWLAQNQADLVLLDYEMPVTSGPQVLEMIRSDPAKANLPVMFLTGNDEKESIMKVVALKPVGYQLKSVDKNTLRDNIDKFFANQASNSR